MVIFLLVCEKVLVSEVFFYTSFFFFFFFVIPNIATICKNKISPSSEPKTTSKELENLRFNYFSVNLTNIFEIIAKYRWKVIFKYRQKFLFIT